MRGGESRLPARMDIIRRARRTSPFRAVCALLFLLLSLPGCDDIFEQDIEQARIEVIAPKHDTHIEAGKVTFLWRPLKGARCYRLSVVSPNFARASRVAADTTLCVDSLHKADRFVLALDPGTYEWSLRAANGVYQTQETVYRLTVDPAETPEPDPETPAGPDTADDPDNPAGQGNPEDRADPGNPAVEVSFPDVDHTPES